MKPMHDNPKWLSFEEAPDAIDRARRGGKKVVHCHGTFDLVHPGHIYHLEEAREQGEVLVVTVTGETHVNKGPGRPYFNDEHRVKALTVLESVDYVIVIPFPAAVEAIRCVRPDIYCKGREYEDAGNDPTGNIADDVRVVEELGGEVRFLGSVVFSSSKLINRHFDGPGPEAKQFCKDLAEEWSPDRIREVIDSFSKLEVLVVGDIIFDRYSEVKIQGLTSKNKTISARHVEVETQAGGSLAVYRHIRQFTDQVKLIGITGTEPWVEHELGKYLDSNDSSLVRDECFTTIVKHRYVEAAGHNEVSKLFSVNYIDDGPPRQGIQDAIMERLEEHLSHADVVLVMDFGHGLMQADHRRFVEEEAPFFALNCQTNSFNYGFNVVNRRYRRADLITIDSAEMALARAEKDFEAEQALRDLVDFFSGRYGFFTRGNSSTFGIDGEHTAECPAFETAVTDTVGAGDAFCALATLASRRELPIEVCTFLGQVAGAQAVKIIGNRDCIRKGNLVKAATTLLSF